VTSISDSDWRKWGRIDPYYAVCTLPEFKADHIGANRESFFSSGRRDISIAIEAAERLYGGVGTSRALDFGSGVGRLVIPLAKRFTHVVGVDISPDMIHEAQKNCANAELSNTSFVLSDDALSAVSGSYDLVHSYIVLQHIPIARGLEITRRLLRLLKPGGVAALHYSLQRTLTPTKAFAYAMKHHIPFGRIAMNVIQGKALSAPAMQMNNYSLIDLLALFEDSGMENVVVMPEQHESALTARILAQKKP